MKNIQTIIIIALAAVILFLLTCKKKKADLPTVPTVADQLKPVIINEGLSKIAEDSLIYWADKYKKSAINWEKAYYKLSDDYTELANNSDIIINQPVNDSCKVYQAQIKALSVRVKQLAGEKDAACKMAISNYVATINKKDNLIANGKKDYAFVRAAFDTCLKNQTTLTKAFKKLSPKREILAGVTGISYYNTLNNAAVGFTIDYRDKKGNQVGAGVFNTKQVQLSWKKVLFKL